MPQDSKGFVPPKEEVNVLDIKFWIIIGPLEILCTLL